MFCPHCHNKIPDGSNICPLCYANLAGVKPERSEAEGLLGTIKSLIKLGSWRFLCYIKHNIYRIFYIA